MTDGMVAAACERCGEPTEDHEYDSESGLWIHQWCLDLWWDACEPLPAPITISCRNGPDVVVGRAEGRVNAWDAENDAAHLRQRGVL